MSQPPPGSGAAPQACWRIDDLARRADVTVDTIRYYQREGLLPPAERAGRANLYGPRHLETLARIKELQGRRFSLAAIRALLGDERGAFVEDIFWGAEEGAYTLDELVERSGVDPELAHEVRTAGLLREPQEFGREAYDREDLELLQTLAELQRLGIPRRVVVELARTYAEGIEATELRVIELFTGGLLEWDADELEAFQHTAAVHASTILPLGRRLVDYTHHRTLQRLTLGAIERADAAPPGGSTQDD
jgi:DNA-binding transcriptional MerR regulator